MFPSHDIEPEDRKRNTDRDYLFLILLMAFIAVIGMFLLASL